MSNNTTIKLTAKTKLPVSAGDLHYQIHEIYDYYDEPLVYTIETISGDYFLVTKWAKYHELTPQHYEQENFIFPVTPDELEKLENKELKVSDFYQQTNAKQYLVEYENIDESQKENKAYCAYYLYNVADTVFDWFDKDTYLG